MKVSVSSGSNNMLRVLFILILVAIVIYLLYLTFNKSAVQNSGAVTNDNPEMVRRRSMDNGNINISSSVPSHLSGMSNPIMEKMRSTTGNGITGEGNMDMMNSNLNEQFTTDRVATDFPKDTMNPEELLPKDNNSMWNQVNPSGEGSLKDRNFLQSGFHIGINTVGQTLRNPNLQLRSEPPCPQVKVSPWMNSTIEPDVSRRPFEIAGC